MITFRKLKEALEYVLGSKMGSNEGGIHKDTETGKQHYIKYYKNPDQAKTEVLTSKIYNHMGIHTLNPEYKNINGKHAVVTDFNPHLERIKPHEFSKLPKSSHHQLGKMYHAAVLTKNWDVVGLEHDNIMKHKHTGNLHSIDTGGSFNFRAMGGHKPYGSDIAEHDTLRNRPYEPSSEVFSHTFANHPEAEHEGLKAVKSMDMEHVHHLFKTSGISNWKDLHSNFVKRRENLISHYKGKSK